MGGKRVARLYAVTWLGIDPCDGKLDVRAHPAPLMTWRRPSKVICLTRLPGQSAPPAGSMEVEMPEVLTRQLGPFLDLCHRQEHFQ